MGKTIKVRIIGQKEVREVTPEEAQKILDKTYSDAVGGMVADGKTGEMLCQICPDVEEIVIIDSMLGGG